MKYKVCALIAALALSASALPSINDVLKSIENNQKMTSDIQSKIAITQQKSGQGTKTIECMFYRRDLDNSFMISMTAPESEKGNGYLRTGDNFWMYRRNTRTFQHINRDESIGGSDAKGDDFETRNLTELYGPALDKDGKEMITEDTLGKIPVYRIEVKAKVKDVSYPKHVYLVQRDNLLVLKDQAFSISNTLMQTSYFLKYTQINGKYVSVKWIVVDEFEKGNKSVIELSGISTNKLDNAIFTKAYLENLSK